MVEKAGSITVNNIMKEHIYKCLPVDLQRQLAKEMDTMTAAKISEFTDSFYDKDGCPIHSTTTSTVNAIAAPNSPSTPDSFTAAFNNNNSDINSIRAPQG